MTREEAIKLMREAGFVANVSVEHWGDVPFAKLCHPTPTSASLYRMLESLINRAAAVERESCAKVCDKMFHDWTNQEFDSEDEALRNKPDAEDCKKAIKARGEK